VKSSRNAECELWNGPALALVLALALGLLAVPLAAEAQQPGKLYRVGNLSSLDGPTVNEAAFWEELRELGWIEGKNITVENRYGGRNLERMATSAADLAHLPVDLFFTSGGLEARQAAKNAMKTIPIVFAVAGEPVVTGLIAGVSRPEANITGLSSMNTDLDAKRLALLKERSRAPNESPCCTARLTPRERPR
jgi:putative ABC transport system substrate-binding protein